MTSRALFKVFHVEMKTCNSGQPHYRNGGKITEIWSILRKRKQIDPARRRTVNLLMPNKSRLSHTISMPNHSLVVKRQQEDFTLPADFQAMTEPLIRSATNLDADQISSLICHVWTETEAFASPEEDVKTFLSTRLSPEAISRDIADDRKRFWVAYVSPSPSSSQPTSSQRIVGIVQLSNGETENAITLPKPLELQRLYVDPKYHGSGLALELVRLAEEEGRKEGFQSIWLCAWQQSGRALRFYEKLGLQRCGEKGFAIGNTVHMDWVMQKML